MTFHLSNTTVPARCTALRVMLISIVAILSACVGPPAMQKSTPASVYKLPPEPPLSTAPPKAAAPALSLSERIALPQPQATQTTTRPARLYSFVAQNISIQQALQIFARAYRLNIVTDNDVRGTVTAEFYDLPFAQAMEALLQTSGLNWQRDGDLIRVRAVVQLDF